VHPVTIDELRIAVAETFDVIVEPSGQDAFTIFAQSLDRTGYARGTLAVREGLSPPVPDLDPRPLLTMADMGHGETGHGETGHGAGVHDAQPGTTVHAQHGAAGDDSQHGATGQAPDTAASGSDRDGHPAHQPPEPATSRDPHDGHAVAGGMPRHPASEGGNPLVDMQTMAPSARLDDPGVGLRGNGRTVLAYGQLTSAFDDPDGREPGRTIELHLTGHMERFVWSFDGVKFSQARPIRLTYGERLRIVLVNDTMMGHPIHLHGMWSDLEDEHGRFLVRKHTVDMPPGTRRSYRVTADALGRWAYHCHMLFHMEAGMFREVRVEE
jgi:CopA family copper-resistance protein